MAKAVVILALAAAVLSQAVQGAVPPADANYDDDLTDEEESAERGGRAGSPGAAGSSGAVPGAEGDLLPPMHASSHLPLFLEEPQDTYVIKNAHATLRCSAINALQVYFKCSNAGKSATHQQEFVDPHDGVRHVEASVNVTRQDVEEFFGEKFTCTCTAWSSRGKIRSRPAAVQYACEYKTRGVVLTLFHFYSPPSSVWRWPS
ncbi:netrin receptor unc-5-like [Frankliniella occidentalis]|uniref:Netrin receptor unc-5-like n=1 Tax=Frankliniella occidentalis TaxID=133901 RepID=A0A9C6U0Q2_FRAOC|nr:netrin receptor unc-5-like [Frankliniella occidentalis]